ncbi:ParA family protein [Variovorax sp. S2]|uniref:ParA family protein n=1 Tax=Variovorax sp. S12S4 TaxID=3029170 RepID=UPI00215CB27D|nr:ParA family protein [Variovorax sp. S12S4]MCR8958562.1 ParA family protein [Variovorax sp. S12S4]
MATVVTVMNMKGGVGKTTVAMHIAGASAAYKFGATTPRRVLVIDYDPQFNLSQALLPARKYFALEAERKTVLSVLTDAQEELNPYELAVPGNERPPTVTSLAARVLSYGSIGHLDIVPSTLDLMYVALGDHEHSAKPMENRFKKFIAECRTCYDLILIDCHPAGSIFTKTSLRNSDHVLIPVLPQKYAVRGVGLMAAFIDAKKQGASGPKPHILFNRVPRKGVSREERSIRAEAKFSSLCLAHTLKKYSAFTEPENGSGFVWESSKPYSTEAFNNLTAVTKEFLIRIGVANP